MKKRELLEKIEALERRVAALEQTALERALQEIAKTPLLEVRGIELAPTAQPFPRSPFTVTTEPFSRGSMRIVSA